MKEKENELKKFKTYELVEELNKREGVEKIYIEPYQEIKIKVEGYSKSNWLKFFISVISFFYIGIQISTHRTCR